MVRTAFGNRANCLQLDLYSQDVLRVFDAEGGCARQVDSRSRAQRMPCACDCATLVISLTAVDGDCACRQAAGLHQPLCVDEAAGRH